MMKRISLVLTTIFFCGSALAQKKFTMQEAVLGLGTALAPASLKQLKWMGENTNCYAQIIAKDSIDAVVKTTVPDMSTVQLFTLPQLQEVLKNYSATPCKKMPSLNWLSEKKGYFFFDNTYYTFTTRSNFVKLDTLCSLPASAENAQLHESTMQVAYTVDNNLFLRSGKKITQITSDGSNEIVYGAAVHRNEFGIDKGIFWSPDGKQIAYYRMDQSMVTDYPITNWSSTPAVAKLIKYPFAGGASHQATLQCYNISSKHICTMDTREPKDQYLTCVTWHPNSKDIYIAVLNRAQNDVSLNKYEAKSGAFVKTLLNEQHKKYVEPQHPLNFIPIWKNDLIWWSQKDGFMHLYKLNEETGDIKPITEGNWLVNEWLGYNAVNEEIIFSGTKEGAMNKQIFAVDVIDGKVRKLNRVAGWHTAVANANCTYLLDEYSNGKEAKNVEILGIEADYEKRLLTAPNPVQGYATAQVRQVTLLTNNDTKLYGKLILPANFDSTKKYPTIVYLYNGPHVQLIKNTFPESGNLWHDYLTQQGYIVFSMDGRGSSNRGFEFESATHLRLGEVETADQLLGINYLQGLTYVDKNNMGLFGWSFGGFMTTTIMTKHPKLFKAAVAGGPVIDWSKYEIMYTERYMSTPEKNKAGYDANTLMDKAEKLEGHLLLIHGTDDDVVTWQNSLGFIKKCVDAGKQVDYFVYPGHPHNVRGKDRVHLMQKVTEYFDLYLQ